MQQEKQQERDEVDEKSIADPPTAAKVDLTFGSAWRSYKQKIFQQTKKNISKDSDQNISKNSDLQQDKIPQKAKLQPWESFQLGAPPSTVTLRLPHSPSQRPQAPQVKGEDPELSSVWTALMTGALTQWRYVMQVNNAGFANNNANSVTQDLQLSWAQFADLFASTLFISRDALLLEEHQKHIIVEANAKSVFTEKENPTHMMLLMEFPDDIVLDEKLQEIQWFTKKPEEEDVEMDDLESMSPEEKDETEMLHLDDIVINVMQKSEEVEPVGSSTLKIGRYALVVISVAEAMRLHEEFQHQDALEKEEGIADYEKKFRKLPKWLLWPRSGH
jgi:hypothetical protein